MRVRPPLSRHAFLALAALGAALVTLPAAAQQKVGINAAVNTNANGTPPGGTSRKLVIGQEIVHNERVTTDTKGQTQILFLDGSSMSVGPDADLTIDEFVYDPSTGSGKMTLTVVQGAMRFVGGKLSKEDNGVEVHTASATIGVRGGIFAADIRKDALTQIIFVFGKAVTVTGRNGQVQELFRPGFAIDIAPNGVIGAPHPAPPGSLQAIFSQLDGRTGASGGATNVPTNATIANSPIPNTISNNVQVSVQQAANSTPTVVVTPSAPAVQPAQVPQNQIQTASSQSQPVVVNAAATPITTPTPINTTTPATITTTTTTGGPIAGAIKTGTAGNSTGFSGQAFGFSGATLQNGTASLGISITTSPDGSETFTIGNKSTTIGSLSGITGATGLVGSNTFSTALSLSPLTPGSNTAATLGFSSLIVNGINVLTGTTTIDGVTFSNGVATANGTSINLAAIFGSLATGTATTSPDGNFFYANLFSNDAALGGLIGTSGGSNDPLFVMGGTPVAQSFFTTTSPSPQFYAFNVQPDFTLGSGSQGQTIPFLPSFAGGTLSNAVVSPLYVATQPNQAFGNFNPISNPNGAAPFSLQASLAINGQQGNQTSALVVSTGAFATSTTSGNVVATGTVRGVYMPGGTSPLTRVNSGFTTVTDGNGNSLFGGNSISGFVLDSNQTDANLNYVTASATSFQTGVSNSTNSFAFNQPVLSTALPTGVGTNRSQLVETGFFGGIAENGALRSFALSGQVALTTNPSNSTLGAVFAGTDPFTPKTSGVTSVILPFGTTSGRNFARSTFIDNNIFGATENYTIPVQITTPTGATITYPTPSSGAAPYPTLAMVTSATVPGAINSLLPSGVSTCSCQYLQWGYWTGHLPATNQGGPSNSPQSAFINTWIAGQPTVTMPTAGTGTYSGAAIGTVFNAGASYVAAGGFSHSYNFGSNIGTVNISNFDGANYSANVIGTGGTYSGTLTGVANRTGGVNGSFYGPGAAETGGGFAVQSTSGPNYIASGIFAGKLTGPIH